MERASSRAARGIMIGLVALVATACQRVEVRLYDRTHRPEVALHYVTRDGSDRYVTRRTPKPSTVTAPRQPGHAGRVRHRP